MDIDFIIMDYARMHYRDLNLIPTPVLDRGFVEKLSINI